MSAIPRSSSGVQHSVDDFIGAEACGECHASHYREWTQSSHGRAGGRPHSKVIAAPFNGQPIRLKDAILIPVNDARGYGLVITLEGQASRRYQVDGVVGAGLMLGGGGQSYFSKQEDGRLLLLPFEFNVPTKRWFCQTIGEKKWAPLSEDVTAEDCGWPPERALGSVPGTNCQNCHGSQIQVSFDAEHDHYDTHVKDFRINCESCHGPGRRHRDLILSGQYLKAGDIGLDALALDDKWTSVDRCMACHANKIVIAPGFLPGMDFHDFFATQTIWEMRDPLTGFDGRLRRFGYQQAHYSSPCFKDGSMTCVDCHSPHTLQYRDIHGRPLEGRFDDGQCSSCHPSKETETHRGGPQHHSVRCTSCHMTYHQPDNVGEDFSHRRSDHRITIPRPSVDRALGFQSACAECHPDTSTEWQAQAVVRAYGQPRPDGPLTIGLRHVAADMKSPSSSTMRARGLNTIVKSLSAATSNAPPAAIYAISYFLERMIHDTMRAPDSRAIDGLWRLSSSDNLDIRAAALTALLFFANTPAIDGARVNDVLTQQGKNLRPIKRKIIFNLIGMLHSIGASAQPDARRALIRRVDEIGTPLDEQQLEFPTTLAMAFTLNQAYQRAHDTLRIAEQSPLYSGTRYSVGTFGPKHEVHKLMAANHMAAGDRDKGIERLRRALEEFPFDGEARRKLCESLAHAAPIREVIQCFDEWVNYDPHFADGYFIRGQYLERLGRFREALESVESGLEIMPSFEPAIRHRDSLRKRLP